MLLKAPICVPDWDFLRGVGSQAIEAVLNVDVDGRLVYQGSVIIKDRRIMARADRLLEGFQGCEVLSWRARLSAGAIDLSLRRPPAEHRREDEQPWECLLQALEWQQQQGAGAQELLLRLLSGAAPTPQLPPAAAAQLLLQSLSRQQPPTREQQEHNSSSSSPRLGTGPELPSAAALARVAALPQRPSALQRISQECGGRGAHKSPTPAAAAGQTHQPVPNPASLAALLAQLQPAQCGQDAVRPSMPAPDTAGSTDPQEGLASQHTASQAKPAEASRGLDLTPGPNPDPNQLAEILTVLQRLQGVVQTQLAAAQRGSDGPSRGPDPEPIAGAAGDATCFTPHCPTLKRVASTLSAACTSEVPGAPPAVAALHPVHAPSRSASAQAKHPHCVNVVGTGRGAVSGVARTSSGSTGSVPAPPALTQAPKARTLPAASAAAAQGAGGRDSAVVVACPPRSLSRYLTKAELAMLAGPEVFSSLCDGGKLTGVKVQFEIYGRRLPEVYAADIERYSPSSPFYLKASACPGVGGLPWRAVPADATVQWKRLADNTLVLAQIPEGGAADWQANTPCPPKRHATDRDAARESDPGEDASVYGGGCSTDDEAGASEASPGHRHKRLRSCSPPVQVEAPEVSNGQDPSPAVAAHTLDAGAVAVDDLPGPAGGLGVLTTAQRKAKRGAAADGGGGFSPRIVASNLYVGRRQLEQLYGPNFKPNTRSDMQLCINGALQPQLFSVQWKEGCHKGSFYPRGAPLAQLRGRFLQAIHWLDERSKRLVFDVRDTPPADWAGQRRTQAKPGGVAAGGEAAPARGSGGGSQTSSGLSQCQDEEARRFDLATGSSFSSGVTSPCPPASDGRGAGAWSAPALGSAMQPLGGEPGVMPAVIPAEAPFQHMPAAPALAAVLVAAPLPPSLPPPGPACVWLAPAAVCAPPPPLSLQAVFASRAVPAPQPARQPSPPPQPQPQPQAPLLPSAVAPFSSRERALRVTQA
ncbi:hypothetical protein HYH03_007869 [Edaphochlamys debaryana]|uniref:Uncharacterized protein n=1 Tax=Edaphochlamys debaryana TaxID=47281 RepID=A0A835Y114_9CHLO|nr:hypothetical protein HYH03_007869 [Edaphochlamys debaryana]|eukprot:KAG2493938.1 hypothetical protein HYH03_007869 [Edaphochlamys debaryana]